MGPWMNGPWVRQGESVDSGVPLSIQYRVADIEMASQSLSRLRANFPERDMKLREVAMT